jgi:two-component system OmpR family response regulator
MRILLVEDDAETAGYTAKALRESGHAVDHAADGIAAEAMVRDRTYDVLIVDRMLPRLDGLALVVRLRSQKIMTPVLFLSALGEVDERIKGLRAGGDDYMVKPFAFSELLARLEALQRRHTQVAPATSLTVGDLELDLLGRTARRAGTSIDLLPREFALLEYLMRHAGQVVTRTMMLEAVWDYRFDPQTNVIDVHMSRLRAKIDRGFATPLIRTVRGAGYSIRA